MNDHKRCRKGKKCWQDSYACPNGGRAARSLKQQLADLRTCYLQERREVKKRYERMP